MSFHSKLRMFAGALLVLGSSVAQAQVQASLVSADRSVRPGHPLTIALVLEQQPTWHTYWINAGTGYATTLEWDLPPGWSAGTIQWPTPVAIRNQQGEVTGNGYNDVIYLPVVLQPSAAVTPGRRVTLKALAKWLMCSDVCIPGEAQVTLTLPVTELPAEPNSTVRAALANMPMPQPTPASWTITASRGAEHVELRISGASTLTAPHFFSEDEFVAFDGPQEAATQDNSLRLRVPISEDADGATQKLVGVLAYTDGEGVYRGLLVSTPLSVPSLASVAATAGSSSEPKSLGLTLLFALLGGLVLNLMPCVFPVLGIKIAGFVNQSAEDPRRVTMHGIAFTCGVLLSFWVLAALLAALRAAGNQIGWGFQLQSPVFVFGLVVVMLVFALNLSGVFEFGLRATGVGAALHPRQGYSGSFFAGVLATVVATPCSAPFLAPALGAALTLPTSESLIVFTAIGIGLSSPYLLLSIFPKAVQALPRPGRWMETFRQVMAFPLYASAAYLLWVLAGQLSESGLLAALFGFTTIALAVWLYGRYTAPGSSPSRVRIGVAGGALLLIGGVVLGWPRAPTSADIVWEPWSPERIEQLRLAGRPIYTDFTARWCATCQANKKLVFASTAVKRYFRDHQVAALKADWTNADPRITAELAKWHRSAVPFNLIYLPGDPHPKVLPEVLTPGIVLSAFRESSASSSKHHEGS